MADEAKFEGLRQQKTLNGSHVTSSFRPEGDTLAIALSPGHMPR